MAHDMGGAAMTALMIVMMLAMARFSLAYAVRAVPAAWRGRLRHAIRRPAGLPAAGRERTR